MYKQDPSGEQRPESNPGGILRELKLGVGKVHPGKAHFRVSPYLIPPPNVLHNCGVSGRVDHEGFWTHLDRRRTLTYLPCKSTEQGYCDLLLFRGHRQQLSPGRHFFHLADRPLLVQARPLQSTVM